VFKARFLQLVGFLACAVTVTLSGPMPTTAFGASVKSSCSKPTSFGSGNNWKKDCKDTFSNGPRVKIRITQTGSTVKIQACASGHTPKGFETLTFASELPKANKTQATELRLHRGSTCSLGSEPVALWGSLKKGMRVTADVSLAWTSHFLTGRNNYKVA
jgi:hypothetical protein